MYCIPHVLDRTVELNSMKFVSDGNLSVIFGVDWFRDIARQMAEIGYFIQPTSAIPNVTLCVCVCVLKPNMSYLSSCNTLCYI